MKDEKFFDIHKLDRYFDHKKRAILQDKQLSDYNRETILRYLKESELGKTLRKGQKRTIGAGRNIQAAGILYLMCKDWFKKDLNKITERDMEEFILNLDKGIIKSERNRPYASESKSNIKKFIRKFYKWLLGDNVNYPKLVEWIDTSKETAEIGAVPGLDKGVWQMVEATPSLKKKALIWVCFDSGFREGEILNCRLSDIEKREDNVYYITCRYSKTKPRTVSLPLSSELLARWLEQHPDKNNPCAQLWQTSRIMLFKAVNLAGKRAHKKHITVHMLRHTSATFWAPKLDRTTFCKRFGWSYASTSPDRYIDFAKVAENKVVDIIQSEKYFELKKQLEEQRLGNVGLQEQLRDQAEQLEKIQRYMQIFQKAGFDLDKIEQEKVRRKKVKEKAFSQ